MVPQGLVVGTIALTFFAVGAGFVGHALWNLSEGIKSRAWPSTLGTTTAAELEVNADSEGTTYGAKVVYEYKVDGEDYSCNRMFFGDWLGTTLSRSAATRRVRKYRAGSTVTVFYDPARPSRAVLESGVNAGTLVEIAFGLIFASAGLLSFLRG